MKKVFVRLLSSLTLLAVLSGCGTNHSGADTSEARGAGNQEHAGQTGQTNQTGQAGQASQTAQADQTLQAGQSAVGEALTFTVALTGAKDHQFSIAMQMLKEILEEKTNGRIQLELFCNGALGSDREAVEGVIMGSIDMTMVAADGAVPAWVPDAAVLSIPYLFADRKEAYDALDHYIGPRLAPAYEAQGLKHLGYGEQGFRHFTNNKRPIKTASDMEGLLIRVQEAPIWFALCDAVGAVAQPIAFNELYTALQQGVVDGEENPLNSIVSSKLYEVQKYIVLDGHTYGAGSIFMNLQLWNSLSPQDQKLFEDAVSEMLPRQRALMTEKDEENLQYLLDIGIQVEQEPDIESFQNATAGLEKQDSVKALFDDVGIVQGVRDYLSQKK